MNIKFDGGEIEIKSQEIDKDSLTAKSLKSSKFIDITIARHSAGATISIPLDQATAVALAILKLSGGMQDPKAATRETENEDDRLYKAVAEVMETVFVFPVNQSYWVGVHTAEESSAALNPSLEKAIMDLRGAYEDARIERDNPYYHTSDQIGLQYLNFQYQICSLLGFWFEHSHEADYLEGLQIAIEMLKQNDEFIGRLLAIKWRNIWGGVPSLEELKGQGLTWEMYSG